MTRRCSHCSNNGHNSRTCPSRGGVGGSGSVAGGGGVASSGGGGGGGVKLFGVRLTDGSFIKKSASMGNLLHYQSSAGAGASASPSPGSPSADPHHDPPLPVPDGYLSDDPNHASCSSNRRAERKKGTPWTAEEHRLFLVGLQKLGKGDWRGISRTFVVSRTPTQVASHAQKFFIRQTNASRRKRRSSLFDMVTDMGTDPQPVPEEQMLPPQPQPPHTAEPTTTTTTTNTNTNSLPSLDLSLGTETAEFEPMETSSSEMAEEEPTTDLQHSMLPTFIPSFVPYQFAFWPPNAAQTETDLMQTTTTSHHQVLKPTPVIPKGTVNVDELVGLSKLKLSENETGPPQLSLNLLGGPNRQSAFHASTAPTFNNADLPEGKSSVIKAA